MSALSPCPDARLWSSIHQGLGQRSWVAPGQQGRRFQPFRRPATELLGFHWVLPPKFWKSEMGINVNLFTANVFWNKIIITNVITMKQNCSRWWRWGRVWNFGWAKIYRWGGGGGGGGGGGLGGFVWVFLYTFLFCCVHVLLPQKLNICKHVIPFMSCGCPW